MTKERDRPQPKAPNNEPRRFPELVSDRVLSWEWESLPRWERSARDRLGPLAPWKTETLTTRSRYPDCSRE
jgi:hypothetical protein